MSQTPLKDFTNADFVAWIDEKVSGKGKIKKELIDTIKENEITGAELVEVENYSDFVEYGVKTLMARRLFKSLQSNFPNQFALSSNPNNNNNSNNNNNNNESQLQVARLNEVNQRRKVSQTTNMINDLLAKNEATLQEREYENQNANGGSNFNGNGNGNGNGGTGAAVVRRSLFSFTAFGGRRNRNNSNNNGYSFTRAASSTEYVVSNRNNEFQVSVFVGHKRKLTRNRFTINNTVRDLKEEIATNESGGNPTGCDVRLAYNGKPLVDDKTLGACGIVNSSCFVTAIIRLNGGAQLPQTVASTHSQSKSKSKPNTNTKKNKNKNLLDNGKNSDIRVRIPHFRKNKNIVPTLEPDCVTYDDSKEELRVKMPCGHVFTPLTIYKWCQRTLEVHSKAEVCCPMPKCNKQWKIEDIVSAADLDEDEHGSLVNVLSHRQLMQSGDFKECPECQALVELPDTVYLCRVKCTSAACKTKGDFCWLCNKSWKGVGMGVCGNKDCHTAYVNESLKIENCGTTKEVTAHNDVECPKLRACPRCLSITEFKANCKHMVCWNCRRSFCFVCLALAGKEVNGYGQKWACAGGDSYAGKCKLAPVQVLK